MKKPMTKSGVLAVCRIAEILKSIQCTFHRRSLVVAEFLTLAINHYEILILSGLEKMSVSEENGFTVPLVLNLIP